MPDRPPGESLWSRQDAADNPNNARGKTCSRFVRTRLRKGIHCRTFHASCFVLLVLGRCPAMNSPISGNLSGSDHEEKTEQHEKQLHFSSLHAARRSGERKRANRRLRCIPLHPAVRVSSLPLKLAGRFRRTSQNLLLEEQGFIVHLRSIPMIAYRYIQYRTCTAPDRAAKPAQKEDVSFSILSR